MQGEVLRCLALLEAVSGSSTAKGGSELPLGPAGLSSLYRAQHNPLQLHTCLAGQTYNFIPHTLDRTAFGTRSEVSWVGPPTLPGSSEVLGVRVPAQLYTAPFLDRLLMPGQD